MEFDRSRFIDDTIDISEIHLSKVLINTIAEYEEAIKNENDIRCENLQWDIEMLLKNAFNDGVFSYHDWKTL